MKRSGCLLIVGLALILAAVLAVASLLNRGVGTIEHPGPRPRPMSTATAELGGQ